MLPIPKETTKLLIKLKSSNKVTTPNNFITQDFQKYPNTKSIVDSLMKRSSKLIPVSIPGPTYFKDWANNPKNKNFNDMVVLLKEHMNHRDTQHVMSWHEKDINNMKKESINAGIIGGDVVETLAKMIANKTQQPLPQDQQQDSNNLKPVKTSAENDISPFGDMFAKAYEQKKPEQSPSVEKHREPAKAAPNIDSISVPTGKPKVVNPKMRSTIFKHITSGKLPTHVMQYKGRYGAGAVGLGLAGASGYAAYSNWKDKKKKNEEAKV